MQITRRAALKCGSAVATCGAVVSAVPAVAAAEDPMLTLWRQRSEMWNKVDQLFEESKLIAARPPELAKELPGVEVEHQSRNPVTCRAPGEVEAATSSVDAPVHLVFDKLSGDRYCDKIHDYEADEIEERVAQRRPQEGARKDPVLNAIDEEIDKVGHEALEIERRICETQASTLQGLAVQALMLEALEKESSPDQFSSLLAKSMGIAARKLVPELSEG